MLITYFDSAKNSFPGSCTSFTRRARRPSRKPGPRVRTASKTSRRSCRPMCLSPQLCLSGWPSPVSSASLRSSWDPLHGDPGRASVDVGHRLTPSVLELCGSDPFVVLDDDNVDRIPRVGDQTRRFNSGQSCIDTKLFSCTPTSPPCSSTHWLTPSPRNIWDALTQGGTICYN